MDKRRIRDLAIIGEVLGATLCLFGALFAVYVALWVDYCDENCGTGLPPIARVQLVVALAGLVPAVGLLVAVVRNRRKTALMWLAIGVATYLTWGVLSDAAVHGWGHLKVF